MYPEQPEWGTQHAAAEPPAGIRTSSGTDRHEDRWPSGGHGENLTNQKDDLASSVGRLHLLRL